MAVDNKENKIFNIDKDGYFEEYAWALENRDIKAAFNDFLAKELSITDVEERDKLYEEYIKNNNSGKITQLQLDVMNYLLKYENGTYKVGQTIADLYENTSENIIKIWEPGYYYIEVSGASGECKNKDYHNQYVDGVNGFKDYTSSIGDVQILFDSKFHFILRQGTGDACQIFRGYAEANKDYLFLFNINDDEFEKSHPISEKDIPNVKNNPDKFFYNKNSGGQIYDFCEFESDPLKDNFYTLHFIKNKYTLYSDYTITGINNSTIPTYLCGLTQKSQNEIINKIKDEGYYKNIVRSNLSQKNCKQLKYSSALENNFKFRDKIFNKNYIHGGDGGFISSIIYINDDETGDFSYNIGLCSSSRDKSNNSKITYIKNGILILAAECGLDSDNSTYSVDNGKNETDKNDDSILINELKNAVINGKSCELDTVTNSKKINVSCQDFSEKTHFEVCESYSYDTLKAGCGRGAIIKRNIPIFFFKGGGENGSGIRMNEFGNAYYQNPNNGHIKVIYLGSKYSNKTQINVSTTGCENSLYCGEENVLPISSDEICMKISFNNSYSGAIVKDGFLMALDDKNNEIVDNNGNSLNDRIIKDQNRYLNYISFKIDSTKLKKNGKCFINAVYDKNKSYVDFKEDTENYSLEQGVNDELKNCSPLFGYGSVSPNSIFSSLFMKKSQSFDSNLLYAYNSYFNNREKDENGDNLFKVQLKDFNVSSYLLNFNIEKFYNFKFFNIYEDILAISFIFKNSLDLPAITDIYGQKCKKAINGAKIEKLTYKLNNIDSPSFNYAEGTNIFASKNTKFFVKLNYNTSRIALDEDASSLSGYTNFYKKNLDVNGANLVDEYFCTSSGAIKGKDFENFQWFEYIPATSENAQLIIKKYTFKFNLKPDLFNELNFINVLGKTDFEVGEGVTLSGEIHNYERVSNLLNQQKSIPHSFNSRNDEGTYKYTYFDNESKFESFVKFDNVELNFCDSNIDYILNRDNFNQSEIKKGNGLFVSSTRKMLPNCYNFNNVPSEGFKISCISEEEPNVATVTINIIFKECNIDFRLTDNYNPGKIFLCAENGEEIYSSIFKNYKFKVFAVGGPTGDGESGGSLSDSETGDDANYGSCGGDGYFGGSGTDGANCKDWGITTMRWSGIIPYNFGLSIAPGGAGGLPGRGFISPGQKGGDGGNALASLCRTFYNAGEMKYLLYKNCNYAGIPIIFTCSVFNNFEDFLKTNIYLKAGSKGFSFNSAPADTNGRGGGAGIPSYLEVSGNNDTYLKINDIFMIRSSNGYFPSYNKFQELIRINNGKKKYLYFEGGKPGIARSTYHCGGSGQSFVLWWLFGGGSWNDTPGAFNFYKAQYGQNTFHNWSVDAYFKQLNYNEFDNNKIFNEYLSACGYCTTNDANYKSTLGKVQKVYSSSESMKKFMGHIYDSTFGLTLYNSASNYYNIGGTLSLESENNISEYLLKNTQSDDGLAFSGKNEESFRTGIVKIKTYNDIRSNNVQTRTSYENFINGNCDNYVPYMKS